MFLGLLEMVRLQAVLLRQESNFGDILIKKHADFESVLDAQAQEVHDDWS
jgi:segregation and condensation protein A